MKYIRHFITSSDAIYNRTTETLYEAPGVAYLEDIDKVIYAPFDINQLYYIDEEYNSILYREYYIDILNNSGNININGKTSITTRINFNFINIIPNSIEVILNGTSNAQKTEVIINDKDGYFDITYTPNDYGSELLEVSIQGINTINTDTIISNIIQLNYITHEKIIVGTYNIRYYNGTGDTGNTGNKSWEYRDEYVFNMIKKHNPDICGLQEVTPQMTQDIIDNLSDYTYVGYGRVFGDLNPKLPITTLVSVDNDEQTGLIYKTNKYNELERGRFFLSDTPDIPSRYEESSFNRLATYVKLQDKETGREFYLFSTHLDNPNDSTIKDEQCRTKQALVLLNNIQNIAGTTQVFLVGDFNSQPTEEAYPLVAVQYRDSYVLIGDKAQGGYICNDSQINEGLSGCSLPGITYTGLYSSTDTNPKRLDYVFTTPDTTEIVSYIADNDNLGLINYPSDHLPVICEMIFV